MRRPVTMGTAAVPILGFILGVSPAVAAVHVMSVGGRWGNAIEVPATAGLNVGGDAQVASLSCASPGNCAAGGLYRDGTGHSQAFVVSERNDRWDKALEVPGTATLNVGGDAAILSVSCPSAGDCAASGNYRSSSGLQAFVVTQRHGTWGKALEVPGTAAFNTNGGALANSVSCASAGNCVAGGKVTSSTSGPQAFLASERNGKWGKAELVLGLAGLNSGHNASIASVSCPSVGNCAAGGSYLNHTGFQVFVVTERNGRWGKAVEVPGSGALNVGGASILALSCGSAGNCSAGGNYTDHAFRTQAFVVSENNGRWGKAVEVPGTATLNKAGDATVRSVSCPSAGNCVAGGSYRDGSFHFQAFVASERNGRWHTAFEVPGTAALNAGGDAALYALSCSSAGNCSAGGTYEDHLLTGQAFVVSEQNGRWGKALEVPGTAALNGGGQAAIFAVSCDSAGECSAGGLYRDASARLEVFVVGQT